MDEQQLKDVMMTRKVRCAVRAALSTLRRATAQRRDASARQPPSSPALTRAPAPLSLALAAGPQDVPRPAAHAGGQAGARGGAGGQGAGAGGGAGDQVKKEDAAGGGASTAGGGSASAQQARPCLTPLLCVCKAWQRCKASRAGSGCRRRAGSRGPRGGAAVGPCMRGGRHKAARPACPPAQFWLPGSSHTRTHHTAASRCAWGLAGALPLAAAAVWAAGLSAPPCPGTARSASRPGAGARGAGVAQPRDLGSMVVGTAPGSQPLALAPPPSDAAAAIATRGIEHCGVGARRRPPPSSRRLSPAAAASRHLALLLLLAARLPQDG